MKSPKPNPHLPVGCYLATRFVPEQKTGRPYGERLKIPMVRGRKVRR